MTEKQTNIYGFKNESSYQDLFSVQNLTSRAGNRVIHDNISFSIGKSSRFIIMGSSGAGKSTLLKVILGSHSYSGKILWKNQNFDISQLAHNIGFQAQNGGLLSNYTVAENIAMPLQ